MCSLNIEKAIFRSDHSIFGNFVLNCLSLLLFQIMLFGNYSKAYGEHRKSFDTSVFSKNYILKLIWIIRRTEEGK